MVVSIYCDDLQTGCNNQFWEIVRKTIFSASIKYLLEIKFPKEDKIFAKLMKIAELKDAKSSHNSDVEEVSKKE